jgi:anti-sigma-K factor RskA
MSEPLPPDDELDALAGEYALGLLDGEGIARAAEMRRRDGRFDQAARAWQARLMPLAAELAEVEPPAAIWSAIAAATAASAQKGMKSRRLAWRPFGYGAVCGAVVAGALLFLSRPATPPLPAPSAVAALASATGGVFLATAETLGASTRLIISPLHITVPAGKSEELWLVLPGEKPAALGLLSGAHAVVVNSALVPVGDQLSTAALAVSLEPPGGSPTGVATGPVIASGKFSTL